MLGRLMAVRLVALDIDGTLLDSSSELRPAVVDAVRRARERGVEVVLATGRRFRTTRAIAEGLGLVGHAVVFNGGVVKDLASGASVEAVHLSRDIALECAETIRTVGAPVVFCDSTGGASETDILTEAHPREHALQREYLDFNREWLEEVDDVTAPDVRPALMIASVGSREALVPLHRTLLERMGSRAEVHFLANPATNSTFVQVIPAATSKWQAVSRLAASRGIGAGEILAIGDDTNDLEMIRGAGTGVAMGNAPERVRDEADWVTAHHDEDGVARALERFVLG